MDIGAIQSSVFNFFQGLHLPLQPTTPNILLWLAVLIVLVAIFKFFGPKKTLSLMLVLGLLLLAMAKTEQYMGKFVRSEGEAFDPWLIRLVFAALAMIVFCYYFFIKE